MYKLHLIIKIQIDGVIKYGAQEETPLFKLRFNQTHAEDTEAARRDTMQYYLS